MYQLFVSCVIIIYFLILFNSPRRGYRVFIFLYPLLPSYIGFGVASNGYAVSINRVNIVLLSIIAFSYLATRKGLLCIDRQVFRRSFWFLVVLIAVLIIKIGSCYFNNAPIAAYMMLIGDILFSIGLFIMATGFIKEVKDVEILSRILFFSYTAMLFIVLAELVVQKPLLSVFASDNILLFRDVSRAFSRDGAYRAVGTFRNPVVLAEFLVVLFPIVISYMKRSALPKLAILFYVAMTGIALISTHSRAGVLVSAIMLYIYIMHKLYLRATSQTKLLLKLMNLGIVIAAGLLAINYVEHLISGFSGNYSDYSPAQRSVFSRANQFSDVFQKLLESPIWGFGRQRNFTFLFEGTRALDNYYLILLLEVGIVGTVIYAIFYFLVLDLIFDLFGGRNINEHAIPYAMSLTSLVLYQCFVAIPTILPYFYIFLGVGLLFRRNPFPPRRIL